MRNTPLVCAKRESVALTKFGITLRYRVA